MKYDRSGTFPLESIVLKFGVSVEAARFNVWSIGRSGTPEHLKAKSNDGLSVFVSVCVSSGSVELSF